MGKLTFLDKIRNIIGKVAWKVFLWSIQMTQDNYWSIICDQELMIRAEKEKK